MIEGLNGFEQTALAGLLLPIWVGVVAQENWSSRAKSIAMLAGCVVIAAFEHFARGNAEVQSFMIVLTAAVSSYYGFWKPSGIAQRVEETTYINWNQDSEVE